MLDDGQCRGVSSEHRVQSLSLLGRVVGIVVTGLPLLVCGLGQSAPAPEVTTGKLTALLGIVAHQ